jgi:hypothetical protein
MDPGCPSGMTVWSGVGNQITAAPRVYSGSLEKPLEDKNLGESPEARMPPRMTFVFYWNGRPPHLNLLPRRGEDSLQTAPLILDIPPEAGKPPGRTIGRNARGTG